MAGCLMELIGGPYDGQIKAVECHFAPQMYVFEDFDFNPPRKSFYVLDAERQTKVQRVRGKGFVTVYRYLFYNPPDILK